MGRTVARYGVASVHLGCLASWRLAARDEARVEAVPSASGCSPDKQAWKDRVWEVNHSPFPGALLRLTRLYGTDRVKCLTTYATADGFYEYPPQFEGSTSRLPFDFAVLDYAQPLCPMSSQAQVLLAKRALTHTAATVQLLRHGRLCLSKASSSSVDSRSACRSRVYLLLTLPSLRRSSCLRHSAFSQQI